MTAVAAERVPDDPVPAGGPALRQLEVSVFRVPTDFPESDGTLEWSDTTVVLVELEAGGWRGLGWSYTDAAAATVIEGTLREHVLGIDAFAVPAIRREMSRAVRNQGRPGVAACAISAVDAAAWDLKARCLGVSLLDLLGGTRLRVPVYGSGGFTSYPVERLARQLGDWTADGIGAVKMKVGRDPASDPGRMEAARRAIGPDAGLFIDANGAYDRKQALAIAGHAAALGVTWFEEPVSSDDLAGLRLLRDRVPAGLEIAAGEYGYDSFHFRGLIEAGAVDVLQPDATRCGGPSGFLEAAALCSAANLPLSAHTAPTLHAHLACAVEPARHVEWFHDHARIEGVFFDGALRPHDGMLEPDRGRPGIGVELRRQDAERFRIGRP